MTTTPNDVKRELHSLEPSAIIELFQLHLTAAVNGVNLVLYFHAGTNELSQNIVFDNTAYSAFPIEVNGFEVTTKGTLPRPSMKISNVSTVFSNNITPVVSYGTITQLLNAYNPLQAEVKRIRTCKKFLDAVNFTSGTNATADPTAMFNGGPESWYIDRIATENPQVVEFELVGKLDLTNLRLPARQVVEHCPWIYKGTECGYTPGKEFDLNNRDVSDNNDDQDNPLDQCAKNLRACELRHPDGFLPFGGFPGARLQV